VSALVCHPQTLCEAVRSIDAEISRTAHGLVSVTYRIAGDLERVRIPAPRAPAQKERLWQRTCCEIFVARADGPAYHEFNFSPSGEWAGYAFERYREGARLDIPDPCIVVRTTSRELELQASIGVAHGRSRVGISVVIEDVSGGLSYWALRHPPGKPDFHRAEAFALELA
jgi:hypothetical protein